MLERILVGGRKGTAFQQALAVLVLFGILAGIQTDPSFHWSWSEGILDSLLYALAGLTATLVAGNYGEHSARYGSQKERQEERQDGEES